VSERSAVAAVWTRDMYTASGLQTTLSSTINRVTPAQGHPRRAVVSATANITDTPTRGWSDRGQSATQLDLVSRD